MKPIEVIKEEARGGRTVVVDAYEKDGTREFREIKPYSLRAGKSGERLMFWCLKRQAPRSLLVKNIVTATPTGRSSAPRYPVEF